MASLQNVKRKCAADEATDDHSSLSNKKSRLSSGDSPSTERSPHAPDADVVELPTSSGEQIEQHAFEHSPLEDSTKQIRLLRILPGSEDEVIRLELSTWWRDDKDAMPPYNAISYTWGDLQTQELFVDAKPLQVRRNCYYALWQARLHYPGEYVWIDSICISQDTIVEKNHQVKNMWSVYQCAERVLSCVGPHADDSQRVLKTLESLYRSFFDNFGKPRMTPMVWLIPDGNDGTGDPGGPYRRFFDRAYWHRLWIIQEVAAASRRKVLCGHNLINFDAIIAQRGTLKHEWGSHMDFISKASLSSMRYEQIMGKLKHFRCADPRDKTYGVLPLIDCLEYSPIQPDYGKSSWELLLELAVRLGMQHIPDAMELLGIDPSSLYTKALVKSRISLRQSTGYATPDAIWEDINEKTYECFITQDSPLQYFREKYLYIRQEFALESIGGTLSTESSDEVLRKHVPRVLFVGTPFVALVPCQTLPSDLVVRVFGHHGRDGDKVLILRSWDNQCYDVVSEAISKNRQRPNPQKSLLHRYR